ncbi:hypothetical protein ACFZAR_38900 [Streptomyces sp. NPDC008222]|uniref:hypothetical protein n=1 Tax=Streptomyces sp. NPDC008222 TaxID=3364820 RepID=UPI0036E88F2D
MTEPGTARERTDPGAAHAGIGRRLFTEESTVKTRLLRVFGRLGVDDRKAAVTSAMRNGLLAP